MPKSKIMIGTQEFDITDHASVQPIWIDVLTDARDIGGIIRLSLGTFVGEGGGDPTIMVATRLRFSMATAIAIRDFLDSKIKGGAKAKKKAN